MFHLLKRLIFNRFLARVVRRHKRFSFPFMIIWALRAMVKKRKTSSITADLAAGETLVVTRKQHHV
jgi:hypothetical protein